MRKFWIAAVAATGLALSSASLRAEDKKEKEKEGVHGILIDNKCGKGQKDEAGAAKHTAKCALACVETGLGVFHGDKWIKFDEKGQKLAKKYLEEAEAKENKDKKDDAKDKKTTKVHVEGKVSEDGKTIMVKAIHPHNEKDDHEHEKKS